MMRRYAPVHEGSGSVGSGAWGAGLAEQDAQQKKNVFHVEKSEIPNLIRDELRVERLLLVIGHIEATLGDVQGVCAVFRY